jgi:hypothetical protein
MVLNEDHLKRLLKEFIEGYYHRARPHQGLHGDTPVPSVKPELAADGSRLVSIRRFTSPLHPRGRLISYSTERPQNKRKTTHRDHHWNHSKRGLRLQEAGSPQRHLVTQDSRACTVPGPATTLNGRPKSASSEVFRVDSRRSESRYFQER